MHVEKWDLYSLIIFDNIFFLYGPQWTKNYSKHTLLVFTFFYNQVVRAVSGFRPAWLHVKLQTKPNQCGPGLGQRKFKPSPDQC